MALGYIPANFLSMISSLVKANTGANTFHKMRHNVFYQISIIYSNRCIQRYKLPFRRYSIATLSLAEILLLRESFRAFTLMIASVEDNEFLVAITCSMKLYCIMGLYCSQHPFL